MQPGGASLGRPEIERLAGAKGVGAVSLRPGERHL